MPIDDIELKHLRVFVAVAETLNFSYASQACGVSQSTVSTIVKQLECKLGVKLIDRTTRRVALTRMGEEFLPGIQRTLLEIDRQIDGVKSLHSLSGGQVHIACVPSVALRLIPKVLQRLKADYPKVAVKVSEVPRGESMQMVRNSAADLAIANEPPNLSELNSEPIMKDVFALVMRRDHKLAARKRVRWVDALEAGLVMMATRTGIRLEIEHGLPPGMLRDKVAYEAVNPSTLLSMVKHDIGVAPLPSLAWPSRADPELTVRPLYAPVVQRQLRLIWRSDRSLSPAAAVCRVLVAEEAENLKKELGLAGN
ncbi:LysR family transcriptional regulator [Alcanivorax marinus]|uniref:LysR family transcriptional regulator n=1 Tax=Alloalcanivorax marinus TaxID=1177169 RepID=A0A9Q3UKV3_9GAMM|nr:LysR family transcriptional regulator [Alloalcanivorax marinus]MCC4307886.1 LysR family transcriptional regulator [Alloalcanivorax marinus]